MADAFTRLAEALADRYRVVRELGAGGMATVYLAHDLRHKRKVAVKVLRPELAAALGCWTRRCVSSPTTGASTRAADWRWRAWGAARRHSSRPERWSDRSCMPIGTSLPILDERRVLILAQLGMTEDALTLLEPLLRRHSWISVHVPRLDPRYDRIRNDPGFEALLAEFAEPQPVR